MIINEFAGIDKTEFKIFKKISDKLSIRHVSYFTNLLKCCGPIDKAAKFIEGAICKILWVDEELQICNPDLLILFGDRTEEYFFDIVKSNKPEIFCGRRELLRAGNDKIISVFNFPSMEQFLKIPDRELKTLYSSIKEIRRKKGR